MTQTGTTGPTGPIFIHSLFRSASTFFFQKFRSLGRDFTCYQEPFNESLEALNRPSRHARLLAAPYGSGLRHPPLDRPYFYEFWLHRVQLQGLYRRAFAYREYFTGPTLPGAQRRWIDTLLECAQGRPVLQICRSSGRAQALRSEYGGAHLHLWREPRAQWWSYKVADYFDSVTRRVYEAHALPAPLEVLAHETAALDFRQLPLTPQQNYRLFYGLWLDAWLQLTPVADLSISVDAIALSQPDNRASGERLATLIGQPLELADIYPSGMVFTPEEADFYEEVEREVGALFVATGYTDPARVRCAEHAAEQARLGHAARVHDAAAEANLRRIALEMMTQLSAVRRSRPFSTEAHPQKTRARLGRAMQWLRQPEARAPAR
jgi:hypothetical protein